MRRAYPNFAALLFALTPAYVLADEQVDFGRDVLPILSENCYQCHGPDEHERKAGLRLDTAEGAHEDLGGYAAVTPGNLEKSEIAVRIDSDDEDLVMPPPDSRFSLNDGQRETLRRWITEGGQYQKHWAFVSPQKSEAVGIDELVDTKLAEHDLKRSPLADSAMLCRRLYLDLVGLPPSPQQIDSFATFDAKNRQEAVQQLVTELLNSDAYAEKWARHWLDVARYSDSNGFEKDMPREQWAWRDWVINAIANDKPYDDFVVEQIAGDLLPNPTQDQLVATGFLRNGMVNEEGAIVNEQFRIEGIVDRMDCIGKSVLGLTLQCAQCHTHKFDPLTHDEYFGLFAFLNDTYEAKSWVYNSDQLKKIESTRTSVREIEDRIKQDQPDWRDRLNEWAEGKREQDSHWHVAEPIECVWIGGLNHPEVAADNSILVLGHPTTTGKMYVTAKPDVKSITAFRIEALRHGDQPFGGPGRSYRGTFAISEVQAWVRETGNSQPGNDDKKLAESDGQWKKIKIDSAVADFSEPKRTIEDLFRVRDSKTDENRSIGPAAFMIDGDVLTAWRGDRGPLLRHTESVAMLKLAEPLPIGEGTEIKIELTQDHGGNGGVANLQLGRFRIGYTDATEPSIAPHDHGATLALSSPNSSDESKLFRAWRTSVTELADANQRIAELESQYPEAETSILHLAQTSSPWQRETHLLHRGEWDKPKQPIDAHTPETLHELPIDNPTRLDFARWLVDEKNPLAARVQVNRVWQAIFGSGLVVTSEDFGKRTEQPEYQSVLDWLAVEFMQHDWSLKHLIRRIVMSETYQQSSLVTDRLLEIDPENHLLARGARFRAEAEVVRDIALTAAGLIHHQVGGPSVFPPVPQSLLDYNFFKVDYWEPAEPPQRYRRSIYLFRKRSMPDPVMTTFDAPNADAACARRVRSNTPLAALVSLNEPVFVEAAQAMAVRVLREGGDSEKSRIDYAYRLTTGRHARDTEMDTLLKMLQSNRSRLADGWLSIDHVGFRDPENRPELPDGVTPQDVAAWAMASRVLLNLDETMTRN